MRASSPQESPGISRLAQTFRDHGYQAHAVGKMHAYHQRDRLGFDDILLDEEGRHHLGMSKDDWETWEDDRFGIYQWVRTGERLTRETFAKYREEGGSIIIHSRTEEMTLAAITHPIVMIASDGGTGHPRGAGTIPQRQWSQTMGCIRGS